MLETDSDLGYLDNSTMPIHNFPDPFIVCTFIHDDLIYVCLFHNKTLTHYHFFWNCKDRCIEMEYKYKMDSNDKNFPYKCFFNADDAEVYAFYRQGQAFRVPVTQVATARRRVTIDYSCQEVIAERITDKDLGTMYLINGKALVVRCSTQVLFFKLVLDAFTGERSWENYHTLNIKGFIYFIKGNKRIQITTDQHIFFYLIDPKTYEPELENVMYNFMNCN